MVVLVVLMQICRASKQYLRLMLRKPVLRIQDINPLLFRYLEELDEVKVCNQFRLFLKKLPALFSLITLSTDFHNF